MVAGPRASRSDDTDLDPHNVEPKAQCTVPGPNLKKHAARSALVIPLDAMASPTAPVATLFGSTGGVSVSGRPATKTAGQRRNDVDDDVAAVRLVSRRSHPTDLFLRPTLLNRTRLFEDARTDDPNEPSAGPTTETRDILAGRLT